MARLEGHGVAETNMALVVTGQSKAELKNHSTNLMFSCLTGAARNQHSNVPARTLLIPILLRAEALPVALSGQR